MTLNTPDLTAILIIISTSRKSTRWFEVIFEITCKFVIFNDSIPFQNGSILASPEDIAFLKCNFQLK
jgi:hypothetical protein